MQKKLILSGLLIVLLLACTVMADEIPDVKGWNGTKWGMTEKEIVSVFGNKIVYFDKAMDWKDDYAKIGLNDYSINNMLYDVRFAMSKATDTLIQVTLSNKKGGITDYYAIEQLLVEKYGKWSYKKEDITPAERISRTLTLDGMKDLKTTWNFSETIIECFYTEISSINFQSQGVSYRMRKTGKGLDAL
ncbi:MAG: hypothetical protein M0P74_00920 [Syntrophales bacterium]|nr:hypothetical protein [Syntrophales bacterium]